MTSARYLDSGYLNKNPTWHVEDSAWKAQHVLAMLNRNQLAPRTIAEVGCGAGEILKQLHNQLDENTQFVGYDISPQAHALSQTRAGPRLQFKLKDFLQETEAQFDLILMMDVVEHVEDYYGFLRAVKAHSRYQILHLPLELSSQTVLRRNFFHAVHESAGHLHYFSIDTARQVLTDVGYEILDSTLTAGAIDLPPKSFKMALARLPRKWLGRIHPEFTSRLLSGFSLLVLTQ